jgi:hypothetical protein
MDRNDMKGHSQEETRNLENWSVPNAGSKLKFADLQRIGNQPSAQRFTGKKL